MKKNAFTLIEMSIVLILISIVLGGFINMGIASIEQQKISTTKLELKAIKTALIAYAAKKGKLPTADSNDDGIGDSNITGNILNLPYLDLKIKAKDNFGQKYHYDVWDQITISNRDSICSSLQNHFTQDNYPKVINDTNNDFSVVAVIISKGKDIQLTGANNSTNREYEMSENKYDKLTNDDLTIELTSYELLGNICDLVPNEQTNLGLVVYYNLNNDSDDFTGNINAVETGSIDYSNGDYASFESSDYLTINLDTNIYTTWTISIWLKNDNWVSSTTNYFLSANSNAPANENHNFYINNTNSIVAQAITKTDTNEDLIYSYSNSITNWHHYLVSHKRTSTNEVTRRIYFDGIEVAEEKGNYADIENYIKVAREDGSNPWENDIDEFRFYNYALTQNQVYTLYQQGRR